MVGAAVTTFGVFLQDRVSERRERKRAMEIVKRRRKLAYARLINIIERMNENTPSRGQWKAYLSDFEELQNTVTEHVDVLFHDTLRLWELAKVVNRAYGQGQLAYVVIEFSDFVQDVRENYEQLI